MSDLKRNLRNEHTRVASRLLFLNDMKIWQKFLLVWLGFGFSSVCFLSLILDPSVIGEKWSNFSNIDFLLLFAGLASISISFVVALAQVRSISRGLNRVIYYFDEIGKGTLNNKIEEPGSDEIGLMLQSLNVMQHKLKNEIEEAVNKAETALRIKTALDNAAANVMVIDSEQKVIFVNKSLQTLMEKTAKSISHVVSGFDPADIIGFDVNRFFPVNQSSWIDLKALTGTSECSVEIDDRIFSVTASAVYTETGKRLGSALEWKDVTEILKVEEEVDSTVNAVVSGDFSQRINTSNKHGFMLTLSHGINQLIEVVHDNLEDIDRVMGGLAQGDLTRKITTEYQGSFGGLAENINKTVDSLREAMGQILEASDVINASSDEIAAGNADMSERTEQQASALEQTSTTMDGLTVTVRHNAENAEEANGLSMSAYDSATKGGQVVNKAIEAMAEINISSSKIAAIISVIDEIAFQTNLLALNASVEAARAGEQGRGFAVVATEVRNLAQRSATAAKEIKDLIVDSVDKVKAGSQLVNESGDTLKEILQGINKVSRIVSEIAAASKEQYAGIEHANRAINQMDDVTQQHAALAEETSAASETLNQQAQALVTLVSRFKLGSGVRKLGFETPTALEPHFSFSGDTNIGELEDIEGLDSSDKNADVDDDWEDFEDGD